MRTSFVLVALCLALVSAVPENPQRIIGGSAATVSQYPFIVSLLYSWDFVTYWQTCGGIILNNRSVLTAAHCIQGDQVTRWRARVGSSYANSGGTVYNSAQFVAHPGYSSWTYNNDVAVLRTATNIAYVNNAVQPASIAGSNYYVADNQVVWAAGFGALSANGLPSEQLQHVQVWTVNQGTCSQRYSSLRKTVTGTMLCAGWLDVGGRDQCTGDHGGPLLHNGVVIGVSSWGECAHASYPGVNARVSTLSGWIIANA